MIGRQALAWCERLRDLRKAQPEPDPKPPAQAFDAMLAIKTRHYEELRQAVASVLYLRNRIEGDVRERRAEIARIHDELRSHVRRGDDHIALLLIGQKRALFEELARAEVELGEVRVEAEEAKQELARQRQAIRALERERLHAVTKIASRRVRRRIETALADLATADGGRALDAVREEIARISAEQALDKELGSGGWDAADPAAFPGAVEGARAELEALKRDLARVLRSV